jgi:hypothetical protein
VVVVVVVVVVGGGVRNYPNCVMSFKNHPSFEPKIHVNSNNLGESCPSLLQIALANLALLYVKYRIANLCLLIFIFESSEQKNVII